MYNSQKSCTFARFLLEQRYMRMRLFQHTGEYFLLMGRVLRLPDRQRMFWRQYSRELEKQGLQSLPIVLLISVFIGAILTIQAKTNTENPLLPTYITGLLTRDTLLLEFSSTILCLILAGKVGSNIASEIGTMRIHGDNGCEQRQLPDSAEDTGVHEHDADAVYHIDDSRIGRRLRRRCADGHHHRA